VVQFSILLAMSEAARVVALLTALDVEHCAIRPHFNEMQVRKHPKGTIFEVGSVPGLATRIALATTGNGNLKAAIVAEQAIAEFDPAALLFAGIAGALADDLALGDVVVATRTYGFHGGREDDDGLRARPRSWEAAHELEQLARHVARTQSWTRFLPGRKRRCPPAVHFRPIVAGEILLNSRNSASASQIQRHYNDAAAIEMESAGAAQAAHLARVPMITIRGVSDSASGEKDATDRSGWRQSAAENAAAFACGLIAVFDITLQGTDLAEVRSGVAAAQAAGQELPEDELHLLGESGGRDRVVMRAEVHGPGQVNQAGRDQVVISR